MLCDGTDSTTCFAIGLLIIKQTTTKKEILMQGCQVMTHA